MILWNSQVEFGTSRDVYPELNMIWGGGAPDKWIRVSDLLIAVTPYWMETDPNDGSTENKPSSFFRV